MKSTLLLIFCFLSLHIFSQSKTGTILKTVDGNSFYSASKDENKKLLIFLHGGVNNPYFEQSSQNIQSDYLLENNLQFITQALTNAFNIIAPITNTNFNWLEDPQKSFEIIKSFISQSETVYEEIYISGFSDGGTGSYNIFYQNPEYFNGLVVFNGYPQHKNFYRTVDHSKATNKKIIFFSTEKDKVIPYEFLLTEYCLQKQTNPNTFFYLTSGEHSFEDYDEEDFNVLFDILTGTNQNKLTEPIQGFIENDKLVELYPFRKKIVKNYNFGKDVYEANVAQHKNLK